MENEQEKTNSDSDDKMLEKQGMWLENDVMAVLIETANSFMDFQWSEQYQSYCDTDSEDRHGHPFESLLRVKRVVNDLTYRLNGGFGLVGCCSQCKGYDGSYVHYDAWWGYCRLCEVRWLIDNVQIDRRIASLLVNPWIENMQATYRQVPLYAPKEDLA